MRTKPKPQGRVGGVLWAEQKREPLLVEHMDVWGLANTQTEKETNRKKTRQADKHFSHNNQ